MNRINQLFANKKEDILSIYFCAGHPTLDGTVPTLLALQNGGVDMVEIGIPFSDPMADGPVIQDAASKALRNGMTLRLLFDQLRDVRQSVHIPLLLIGYLNVTYHYGFEAFCRQCRDCGIDGAIIPDLPFDLYLRDYKATADRYGLRIVMLITPETSDERIRLIDQYTDGFIYQVSTDATTGAQRTFGPQTISYFERIETMGLTNPTLVGFGISNRATREAANHHAAGCIVGSKFVKLLEQTASPADAVAALHEALEKD
jgi:tryptophan synthase alpha chain